MSVHRLLGYVTVPDRRGGGVGGGGLQKHFFRPFGPQFGQERMI